MGKDNKVWRLKNPERWKELQKKYRDKTKDKRNAKQRELYNKNKGNVMSHIDAGKLGAASREKRMIEITNKIFEKGFKKCTICGKDKNLDEYYPDPRNVHTMLQGACKQCLNNKSRIYNANKRNNIINSHGGKCKLCGIKIIDGVKYAIHHISYDPEKTVLLCHRCHNTLHALRIYKLDFIKDYGSDLAPYEWAKLVIKLYETS